MTLTGPKFVLLFQVRYFCYVSFQTRHFFLQFTALIRNCICLRQHQKREQILHPERNTNHLYCTEKKQIVS